MITCASCGSRVAQNGRFCSACGAVLNSDDVETMAVGAAAPEPSRKQVSRSGIRPPSSSGSLLTEGRFLPGTLLAERYRIIALLGLGGMGEVYRADDLTLGQPVALKFLPEEASKDDGLLERFRNEVRVARRVSHPNVCRVYDLGEVEGHTFFTMEYIDGEDLASLLRRIGRLPADKALEIARQLCAGLAAAHAKGVLHRDLKPANIMLDGRGQVSITDFGLAGVVEQIPGSDIRSGTPAYMSPEQLAGQEVTEKSDIYALGLVLYEIFTGKRAFDLEALPELVRARNETAVSRPSTLVRDIDPAVERVILRCLEADPGMRPASVLNIAAALPGGDPLAAALAAGETPSPQMVAAAGQAAGLAPRTAVLCLVTALLGLAAANYVFIKISGMGKLGLEQSPADLTVKAKEIIAQLGYQNKPLDTATAFDYDSDFLDYQRKNAKPTTNWDAVLGGRPGPLMYWYRQSPQYMMAMDFQGNFLTPGIATETDPPQSLSGMVNLRLDTRGRLLFLQAVPPEKEEPTEQSHSADWNPLFAAAGLDPAQFQTAAPIWNPLVSSDTRAAWQGKWPGTGEPLHIEAAAFHDRPVFFSLMGPWTKPHRMNREQPNPAQKAAGLIFLTVAISMVVGAILLARRNYLQGKGDRKGAFRLAWVIFALAILLWMCRGHWVASLDMLQPVVFAISTALLVSGLIWVLYLSLEPYVRRHWPQSLISWSRLLMGRVHDPLVGRDVLFGVLLGVFWLLIFAVGSLFLAKSNPMPDLHSTDYLTSSRMALSAWLLNIPNSIQTDLIFFFLLFILRVLLRKEWLAGIVFVGMWAALQSVGREHAFFLALCFVLVYGIVAMVVFRVGAVALAVAIFSTNLLGSVPLTFDPSLWYFGNTLLPLLSVIGLAIWGFYTALAGQKLWSADAFN